MPDDLQATGSRAAKVGMSPDYLKLLRGEISVKEYIARVYAEVSDGIEEDESV